MTNEQILEKIQPYKPSEIIICMDLARADERGKVIGELDGLIQTWAESEQNNSFPQDSLYWGGWWVMADIIATKLNSLRDAK